MSAKRAVAAPNEFNHQRTIEPMEKTARKYKIETPREGPRPGNGLSSKREDKSCPIAGKRGRRDKLNR